MPAFNVSAYHDRLRTILRPLHFTESILGSIDDYPISAWTRPALNPETKEPIDPVAHVYISAGVHGDEPAGPLALTRLFQQFLFSTQVTWHFIPLVNPVGMAANKRENGDGLDINRDFRHKETKEAKLVCSFIKEYLPEHGYDLALCLHEDYEATGTYIYELNSCDDAEIMGRKILESASEFIPLDPAAEIDEHVARDGLITPLKDRDLEPSEMEALPEAVYLFDGIASRSYTIETPSSAYIENRVAAQAAAVRTAVAHVLRGKLS